MICYPVSTEHLNPPVAAVFSTLSERTLVTAYPFCTGERRLKTLTWFAKLYGKRHVILDSGLFTLIKDINKKNNGKQFPKAYYDAYFERYKRVLSVIPDHWTIIELDMHIVPQFDVEPYRQWLLREGWKDRTLFVWHYLEGINKFAEYFERFSRVGCSQREMSFFGAPEELVFRLLASQKGKWKDHHVHLLGTAQDYLFDKYPDSFSCDATNWNTVALFGETRAGFNSIRYNKKTRTLQMPPHIRDRVHDAMPHMIEIYRQHPENKRKTPVRIQYLQQLAAGLLAFQDHEKSLRKRSTQTSSLDLGDPIDYWKKESKRCPRTCDPDLPQPPRNPRKRKPTTSPRQS